MGSSDDDDTCDTHPWWVGHHKARELMRNHGAHRCPTGAIARAVLEGKNERAWDEPESLATVQDWVDAYRARQVPATLGEDGIPELVADESVTAVLVPWAFAGWVYDRLEDQTAVLAPSGTAQFAGASWAFLVRPEPLPDRAVRQLRTLGVQILDPGERLSLPMAHQSRDGRPWWLQWPRAHLRYKHELATPPMNRLINLTFWAAHSLHQVNKRDGRILFEALPNTYITIHLAEAAAAGVRKRASVMPDHQAAGQLIEVGARIVAAAGSDGVVLIRKTDGTETTVDIDDALLIKSRGRWPIEYEVHR
ncbi:hypothetical protein [Nocardia takedensis]|uniref:hypothetical protein n=1 Tax=Nocardia takedensis TaxID=259390 RepID=UPI0002EFD84F|nr:hypothetical protein [Nocardia takedensis]